MNLKNVEKSLKRWLKKKVTITMAMMVAFMISGQVANAESKVIAGVNNAISPDSSHSMIGAGGDNNIAMSSPFSMIGAGSNNNITTNSWFSIIGAGESNTFNESHGSMIGAGGHNAMIYGNYSMIGAGENNKVEKSDKSIIGAGQDNKVESSGLSMIGAGRENKLEKSNHSMIGAGYNNIITGNSGLSMIGAGQYNDIQHSGNTFIFGSYSKAENISNAVLLGKYVKGVEGAISVGGGSEFYATGSGDNTIHYNKIVNLHEGDISETSHDAINGSQLYNLAKATDTNIDTAAWKKKLGVGAGGNVDLSGVVEENNVKGVTGGKVWDYLHQYNVELGGGSKTNGNDGSIAIGSAEATGTFSIAIGQSAKATSKPSIAIGDSVETSGDTSIGIGSNVQSRGMSGIALGDNAEINSGQNHIAIGTETKIYGGENNILIGSNSINEAGSNKIMIGRNNDFRGGNNSVILGSEIKNNGASSDGDNSITLGYQSTVINNSLSIGSKGNERKIVFVANGDISETSHDAINGSQLYKLAKATDTNIDTDAWKKKLGVGDVDLSGYAKRIDVINGNVAGDSNAITKDSSNSMIGAGYRNKVENSGNSMIGAGDGNTITKSTHSMIGAGDGNTITGNSNQSMIGAGQFNKIGNSGNSMIGAGYRNKVEKSNQSMIGVGEWNTITENSVNSMIGAGEYNKVENSERSMIGAGYQNKVENSGNSMIGAGRENKLEKSNHSMIGAGYNNIITGNSGNSMIGAGVQNTITENSYESMIGAGRENKIENSNNTFIFGSYSKADTTSDAVLLGKYVKGVEGAISVGGGSEYYATGRGDDTIHYNKIVNLHEGDISEISHDAINGSQLYKLAKATDTNIDTTAWKEKLGVEDVDLTNYYTKEEIGNSYYDKNNVDTKLDGKANINADNIEVAAYKEKLGINNLDNRFNEKANVSGDNLTNISNWQKTLQIGTGTIGGANDGQTVTGTTVKTYVTNQGFIKNSEMNNDYISSKITKGNIVGDNIIEVANGENKVFGNNVTLSLNDGSIVKDKLDKDLQDEITNKANTTDLNNYSKIDASNINKEEYKKALGIDKLASTDNLKNYFTKEEITKNHYNKTEVDTKLDGKANINADNIEVTAYKEKLGINNLDNRFNEKANVSGDNLTNISNWQKTLQIGTGTIGGASDGQTVTGTTVKTYVTNNYYNKKEIDKKIEDIDVSSQISGKANTDLGNITKDGKTVIKNLAKDSVSVVAGNNTTVTTKTTTDGNIQYAVNVDLSSVEADLNGKADTDLGNITDNGKTVINDIINENHYNKKEIDNKIKDLDVGNQLEKIENVEKTNNLQDEKINNNTEVIKKEFERSTSVDKQHDKAILENTTRIEQNSEAIANNSKNIQNLHNRINKVDKRVKQGVALSAALASVKYPSLMPGETAVGAGISEYGGQQGLAVGVAYMPTENLQMSVQYSGLVNDRYSGAVSGSVSYKFNFNK